MFRHYKLFLIFFQEAQEKLLELDRQSNKLDAFIEKSKNATIEESEVTNTWHQESMKKNILNIAHTGFCFMVIHFKLFPGKNPRRALK